MNFGKYFAGLALLALGASAARAGSHPNIIIILSDDVGYGDLGVNGATKVHTPNIDLLASQGMNFTNAHTTASTCSPSRFSMLTGLYAWRPPAAANAILDYTDKLTIPTSKQTIASLLKGAGYTTGVIGKWHLGLGSVNGGANWNGEIKPGPNEIGFDYSFIIPATPDRVPCVYVENHAVYNLNSSDPIRMGQAGSEPTGTKNPGMLVYPADATHSGTIVDSISRMGFMNGGFAARWHDEDQADDLNSRAVKFIQDNKANPFFLYYAANDVHVPRYPHPRFRGTTQCGMRCDALAELDWCVGRITKTLDSLGLADSTLVIFSSDNGGVVINGYADGSDVNLNGHSPNGVLRGFKGSIYEGGSRVPFMVKWPGQVTPGTVSGALTSQVDMLATFGAITNQPVTGAVDSWNLLPTLQSDGSVATRTQLVIQDNNATTKAIIKGDWKFIEGGALYNLKTDLSEAANVASGNGAKVTELKAALAKEEKGPTTGLAASTLHGNSAAFCLCIPRMRGFRILGDRLGKDAEIKVYRASTGALVYRSEPGKAFQDDFVKLGHSGLFIVTAKSGPLLQTQRLMIE